MVIYSLKPVSHYDFKKKIAHVWLDKNYYNAAANEDNMSMPSAASSLSTTTTKSKRFARVCTKSLHPLTGALKCRLNRTLGH